jgi:hypothetical protein
VNSGARTVVPPETGNLDRLLEQLERSLAVWREWPPSQRERAQINRRLGSVVLVLGQGRARPPRRRREAQSGYAESLPLFA